LKAAIYSQQSGKHRTGGKLLLRSEFYVKSFHFPKYMVSIDADSKKYNSATYHTKNMG